MPAGPTNRVFRVCNYSEFITVLCLIEYEKLEVEGTLTDEKINELIYEYITEFCCRSEYMLDTETAIVFVNEKNAISILKKYAKRLAKIHNTYLFHDTEMKIEEYVKKELMFKNFYKHYMYNRKKYATHGELVYKKINIEVFELTEA